MLIEVNRTHDLISFMSVLASKVNQIQPIPSRRPLAYLFGPWLWKTHMKSSHSIILLKIETKSLWLGKSDYIMSDSILVEEIYLNNQRFIPTQMFPHFLMQQIMPPFRINLSPLGYTSLCLLAFCVVDDWALNHVRKKHVRKCCSLLKSYSLFVKFMQNLLHKLLIQLQLIRRVFSCYIFV